MNPVDILGGLKHLIRVWIRRTLRRAQGDRSRQKPFVLRLSKYERRTL